MKYLVLLACIALAAAGAIKAKDEKKTETSEVTTQAPPQGWLNPWFYSGPEGKFVQKPFYQTWLPPYPVWGAYPQAQAQAQGAFYPQAQGSFYPQAQAAFYPQQPQFNPYQGFYGNPAQQGYQGVEGQQPAQNPLFWKNFYASQPWAQQQENVQEPGAQQNVPFWAKPWANTWNPNVNVV